MRALVLAGKVFRAFQACNIYVSEGRNSALIAQLEATTRQQAGAALVNTFVDPPYNRTGFTLVAEEVGLLVRAGVALAQAALQAIDLQEHAAAHPRLGVVDHISCHPLTAAAGLQQSAELAHGLGRELGNLGVPVFLYGRKHPSDSEGPSLADVRRSLGYFRGSKSGNWEGSLLTTLPEGVQPDFGPREVPRASGVACIGATPWVVNYNVLLKTADMTAARDVARRVSGRHGGLPGVQAMALPHEGGTEVACNLLSDGENMMPLVLAEVERLAQMNGVAVDKAYRIGQSAESYAHMAQQLLK